MITPAQLFAAAAELNAHLPPTRAQSFGRKVLAVAKQRQPNAKPVTSRHSITAENPVKEAVKRQQEQRSGTPSPQQAKEAAEKERKRYEKKPPRKGGY